MNDIHRSDVYLRAVEAAGIPVPDRRCRLVAGAGVVKGWRDRFAAMGLGQGERLIAVNSGGNWNLKQWPVDRFAELVKEIHVRKIGKVVLVGAPKDLDRAKEIAKLSGVDPAVTAGDTGLSCLAGLLSCVDVLVTADTGPLHLAGALGTKAVALFGPTRPEITGPRGVGQAVVLEKDVGCNKAPCYYLECPDNRCMKAIEVEDVLQTLRAL
jgi:ADP-heptose:LPS heptosyltransferase